ncbi:MAG TPA: hypothetical protein VFX29_01855 [Longimicrobiaceae bacterium]|nr:hypothetical protein [Longimicrobiaceae bacterium]
MSRRSRARRRNRLASRGLDELLGLRAPRSARDFGQLVWMGGGPALLSPWDAMMFRSFRQQSLLLELFGPPREPAPTSLPGRYIEVGGLKDMRPPVVKSRPHGWRDPFRRDS